jgi:5-methylcytosine-specific restriction endonuclease McrA
MGVKSLKQLTDEFNALAKVPKKRTPVKETRKYWIGQCDTAFALYIKARDGKCLHCGKVDTRHNCSHVIPKSTCEHLRWDENNAQDLCYYCHMQFWHKSPAESGQWFRTTYPQLWSYLERNRYKLVKHATVDELKAIYQSYIAKRLSLQYN